MDRQAWSQSYPSGIPRIISNDGDRALPWNAKTVREKERTEQKKIQADHFRTALPNAPTVSIARVEAMDAKIGRLVDDMGLLTTQIIALQDALASSEGVARETAGSVVEDVALVVNDANAKAELAVAVAEKIAGDVEEERKGLKERIAEHVGGLPVIRKLDGVKATAAWTIGQIATVTGIPVAGIVVVALGICAVLWRRKIKPAITADIEDYRATGANTGIQDLVDKLPGRIGDVVERVVDKAVERKLGPAGGAAPKKSTRRAKR